MPINLETKNFWRYSEILRKQSFRSPPPEFAGRKRKCLSDGGTRQRGYVRGTRKISGQELIKGQIGNEKGGKTEKEKVC